MYCVRRREAKAELGSTDRQPLRHPESRQPLLIATGV